MLVIKVPSFDKFAKDFFNGTNFGNIDYEYIEPWENKSDVKCKVKESEVSYTLSLALPGFKKEDIDISVEDNYLIVSSKVEKDDFKQPFENKYLIPDDVNMDQVNASMEDGILNVVIGKYLEVPKTSRKININ